MRQLLIVANQTLPSEPLLHAVRGASAEEPTAFHVMVPATPPRHHLTYTEGEARALALARLDETMARLHDLGVQVSGEVGNEHPMMAITDAMRTRTFDGIIISTFPVGLSRWLRQDLPHRAERRFGVPVTHVVAEPARL